MKLITIRKYKKIIISACLLLMLTAAWIYYSPYGAKKHLTIQQKSNLVTSEIGQLKADNIKLQQEIDKIKKDPKLLEDIARKEYGLLKKNEIVFDFSKGKKK